MEPMTTPIATPVVLTAGEIAQLPLQALDVGPGVTHRVLWRSDDSMAGVMTVERGHRLGRHTHRKNHHHMWVLHGEATVLGRDVGPGSYVHVPNGVEHDIDATRTVGCTLLYLYLRVTR
jgi:mannose-6-phosphate isomerase-like protein (cupin superfamily)